MIKASVAAAAKAADFARLRQGLASASRAEI